MSVLTGNSAQDNEGRGFVIGSDSGLFDTNTAENNGADGFFITGSNNTFKSNEVESNDGVGFNNVSGTGNRFNTNRASSNGGKEWVVVEPGQIDEGGNRASGSPFPIPPDGGTSIN